MSVGKNIKLYGTLYTSCFHLNVCSMYIHYTVLSTFQQRRQNIIIGLLITCPYSPSMYILSMGAASSMYSLSMGAGLSMYPLSMGAGLSMYTLSMGAGPSMYTLSMAACREL